MKKYKLIKEYPGSPELGTIEEVEKIFDSCKMGFHGKYLYNFSKHPEFWEEVIEKDYEILSLICNKDHNCLFKNDIVYYKNKQYEGISKDDVPIRFTLEEHEKNNFDHWSIHSIKRLSDGEIFTIGEQTYNGKITKFEILDSSIAIFIEDVIWIGLKVVEKKKQPLFTTEDGVDIYLGDIYVHLIIPGFHNEQCVWNIIPYETEDNIIYTSNEELKAHGRLLFSTKEKAEEYILMNKPCLSINEILKSYTNTTPFSKKLYNNLRKLVNTKIKNN